MRLDRYKFNHASCQPQTQLFLHVNLFVIKALAATSIPTISNQTYAKLSSPIKQSIWACFSKEKIVWRAPLCQYYQLRTDHFSICKRMYESLQFHYFMTVRQLRWHYSKCRAVPMKFFDTDSIGFRQNPRPLNRNPTVLGRIDVIGNSGIVCIFTNLLPDGRVLCGARAHSTFKVVLTTIMLCLLFQSSMNEI